MMIIVTAPCQDYVSSWLTNEQDAASAFMNAAFLPVPIHRCFFKVKNVDVGQSLSFVAVENDFCTPCKETLHK